MKTYLRIVYVAAWTVCVGLPAAQADDAKSILKTTGVKGGLVVHVGCGDGTLTAALRANDRYLVHGLDRDAAVVARARATVVKAGLYGKVSVEPWIGQGLPYMDNLVNLLVVQDAGRLGQAEMMRVLCPGGVAYVRAGGAWKKTVKALPKAIDEWTHYLYDATNNAVSHDTRVGPPRRLQWAAGPRWSRHHEHMSSVSAMVSAHGRVFTITDEGSRVSIQLPPKWRLIARDAFNGTLLWKRDIATWYTHLYPLKSGPAILPRRLIAVGERVYVALGIDQPLVALDAATGETVRTYETTRRAEEVIHADGVLYVVSDKTPYKKDTFVWDDPVCWTVGNNIIHKRTWGDQPRTLRAIDAETGKVLWTKDTCLGPGTLATDGKRVVYFDSRKVVSLDPETGKQQWASDDLSKTPKSWPSFMLPILSIYRDTVLCASGIAPQIAPKTARTKAPAKRRRNDPHNNRKQVLALDAATGKKLWSRPQYTGGHRSPEDLFCVEDLVWTGDVARTNLWTGYDLRTGETKREFKCDSPGYWFHHRCHRSKATTRYFMPSRTGIEYVDWRKEHWDRNHWVRGACVYGVMPANGMTYAPQHPCACYLEAKLHGLNALLPAAKTPLARTPEAKRLEKGPAYAASGSEISHLTSQISEGDSTASAGEWPTYRHDAARSGYGATNVRPDLAPAWEAKLGGKLSAVTVAGGQCFVADEDAHTVYALDAATGKMVWHFTAGGRVDSPPTLHRGFALFGCRDGYVYSVRAADGALAWRYLAAPTRQRIVSYDQVESRWPVHGSVLVRRGVIYCVAGRSAFLDGGMRLCRLDAASGTLVSETVMDEHVPGSQDNLQKAMKGLNLPPALPDVLSCDDKFVYMRSQKFDFQGKRTELFAGNPSWDEKVAQRSASAQIGEGTHLFASIGFLDGDWFHRSYWLYGRMVHNGCNFWFRAAKYAPAGRILVFDEDKVYGFGRLPKYFLWTPALEYRLFAAERKVSPTAIERALAGGQKLRTKAGGRWIFNREITGKMKAEELSATDVAWSHEHPPLLARGMVLAGTGTDKTLFVAGPPDVLDEEAAVTQRFRKPRVARAIVAQDQALAGGKGALLWSVDANTGRRVKEIRLKAMPRWDGMAAAEGRLLVSTTDGRVLCFK